MPPFPEAVKVGEWRVEPELDLIMCDGHTTKLEPRAMRVLLCLIARSGHVVSVSELLEEAWPEVVVGSESVYQAIALLRRTLGDDSHHPTYIAHVPRKGYRLVAPIGIPPSDSLAAQSALPAAAKATPSSTVPAAPGTAAVESHSMAANGSAVPGAAPCDLAAIDVPPSARAPGVLVAPAAASAKLHRLVLRRHTWIAAAVATATLAAAYLYVRDTQPGTAIRLASTHIRPVTRQAAGGPSIAVLPFLDLSEKQDLGYFADGLSEELIDLLSRGSDLRVPARTSSFYFKGKAVPVRDIAGALNVDNLLEGSVRRSGHRVRVTAQLIRAENGYHLWSQTYDREFDETFAVEDDIAQAVTKTLQAKLNADHTAAQAAGANSEVHGLRLQCQFFVQRNTRADADKAVDCYRQLLTLAPRDAASWAGYADALWRQPLLTGVLPPEMRATRGAARQAAEQALALDVTLAAPHAILAMYHRVIDRDWAAARAEVSAALTADPTDPSGLLAAARLAITLGQFDRAVDLLERARLRDPLNFIPYARLSDIYLYQGNLQEAQTAAQRRVDLSPEGHGGYSQLADVLLARGEPEAALESVKQEPNEKERLIGLALAYHALSRRADADDSLRELTRRYGEAELEIADVYAYRGETDRAFAVLDRAFAYGDQELLTMKVDIYLRPLHADPRYRALLRKLDLPEDESGGSGMAGAQVLHAASSPAPLNAPTGASTLR